MNYYIEIELINSKDAYNLWSAVYTQLHLALVSIKNNNNLVNIGVSFPEYHYDQKKDIGVLGSKLRLFTKDQADLQKLDISNWLSRLKNYIIISDIYVIPLERVTSYAIFKRKQIKTNADRLARRAVKRNNNINYAETKQNYENIISITGLPFIQIKSLTNQHEFKIFIEKKVCSQSLENSFNCYGLSANSSVPEF